MAFATANEAQANDALGISLVKNGDPKLQTFGKACDQFIYLYITSERRTCGLKSSASTLYFS